MPTYMEEQPITVPLLDDGIVAIGDLWNCNESVPLGLNLFGQELEEEHLVAYPRKTLDYTLTHVKDTSDAVKNLYVKAELALDLLNGKIKMSGGVTYDDKDDHKFNEEKLDCTYKLETYQVRVLPSAKDRIDKYTKDQLVSGKLKATHVCTEIIMGAETTAHIFIHTKDDTDNRTIDAFVSGSLKVGPISASASAHLVMLDVDEKHKIEKRITVVSKPPLKNNPNTIQEMFTALEAVPSRVEAELHFPMIKSKQVVGIPLRFKLVPINQFINIEAERQYAIMAAEVMSSFMDMIVTLKDFQKLDHIKRLIVQKDRRLQKLLNDPDNPWTADITKREMELQTQSKEIQTTAFLAFGDYKNGKKEEKDLNEIVVDYKNKFDVATILQQVQTYTRQGKELLTGVQASDVEIGNEISFFSNITDLKEWFSSERRIKFLVNTSGDTPHGALLFLFDNSVHLKKLGIDVGIAYPNISDGFTLTMKVRDRQVVYPKEDIRYALEVLATAVGVAEPVSNRFYTVNGAVTGVQLPLQEDALTDITSLIATLRQLKQVNVCTTYLRLSEALSEKDSRLKLVMTMDAIDSVAEAVNLFRRLRKNIAATNAEVDWIASTFGLTTFHDAPLLFIFLDGELVGVCMDNLDLQIFLEILQQSSAPYNFDLLSHRVMTKSCLYPDRASYALQVVEMLGQTNRAIEELNLGMTSFPKNDNAELQDALELNRAALSHKPLDIISAIASICARRFPDLGVILKKSGWNPTTGIFNAEMNQQKWLHLVKGLRDFFAKLSPFFAKIEYYLYQLRESVKVRPVKEGETQAPPTPPTPLVQPSVVIQQLIGAAECTEELKNRLNSYEGCTVDVMINGVINALEWFSEDTEKHFSEAKFFYLRSFIGALDEVIKSDQDLLQGMPQLVLEYTAKAKTDQYPGSFEKIKAFLNRRSLFQTLGLLSRCREDPKLFLIQQEFLNLVPFAELDVSKQIGPSFIELLEKSKFVASNYEELWGCGKFTHLMSKLENTSSFVEAVKVYQCRTEEGLPTVPAFLPKAYQEIIKPMLLEGDSSDFEWETEWPTPDDLLQVLQAFVARDTIPEEFQSVLFNNLSKDDSLKEVLLQSGTLFYWNAKLKVFEEPWDIRTAKKAIESLTAWVSSQTASSREVITLTEYDHQELEEFPPTTPSLNEKWQALGPVDRIASSEYFQFGKLVDKPSLRINELPQYLSQVVKYISQNLKMGNNSVLDPTVILSYIDPTGNKSNTKPPRLTSNDLIILLLTLSEDPVVRDIATKLVSNWESSLPLIIPFIDDSELDRSLSQGDTKHFGYKLLYPIYQDLFVAHASKSLRNHGLFSGQKFRLITAVRLGDSMNGKSMILNQLFKKPNIFASASEPGKELGWPRVTNGIVEFIWLTPETCTPEFWSFLKSTYYSTGSEDVILLANLHGDPLVNQEIVRELEKFEPSFLLFVMPTYLEDFSTAVQTFEEILANKAGNMFRFMVNPKASAASVGEPHEVILSSEIGQDSLTTKLQVAFTSLLTAVRGKGWIPDVNATPESPVFMVDHVQIDDEVTKLVTFIKRKTIKAINSCLKLHKADPKITEDYNNSLNQDLFQITDHLNSIMSLPIKIRRRGLSHLASVLHQLSEEGSYKYKSQMEELKIKQKSEPGNKSQVQIRELKATINERTLSIYDLLRELELVAELSSGVQADPNPDELEVTPRPGGEEIEQIQQKQSENKAKQKLFSQFECNFLDGSPTQLMHNFETHGSRTSHWMKGLMARNQNQNPVPDYHQYCPLHCQQTKLKDLKIFVISIVGLETSGKSGLLNHLFGSVTGQVICSTKGIQMRLVYLEPRLVNEIEIDAILLLDTEGLDPTGDEEVIKYQKSLIASSLSLSHLTLINIGGDTEYFTQAFETVLIRVLRLSRENRAPLDFLLINQTESGVANEELLTKFETALANSSSVSSSYKLEIGARNKHTELFERMNQRLRDSEVVFTLRPKKLDGAPFFSDLTQIHASILKSLEEAETTYTFETWYNHFTSVAKQLAQDTFPLGSPNLEHMTASAELGKKVDKIKDAIDSAFKYHVKKDVKIENIPIGDMPKFKQDYKLQMGQVGKNCVSGEAQCEICLVVAQQRETLYQALKDSRDSYTVRRQLTNYLNTVKVATINYKIQSVVNKSELAGQPASVISTFVKVVPAGRLIQEEIYQRYANVPHILKRLEETGPDGNPVLPQLSGMQAFEVQGYDGSSAAKKKSELSWEQEDQIQAKMKDLPKLMVLEAGINTPYQIGMVRHLQAKLTGILNEFETRVTKNFTHEFFWTAHHYGIAYFLQFMNQRQVEWDKDNNPLHGLK